MASSLALLFGLGRIDYVSHINEPQAHQIQFTREAGFFWDLLTVAVDGEQVFQSKVSFPSIFLERTKDIFLDGLRYDICWRWNWFGNPKYIIVTDGKKILTSYGRKKFVDRWMLKHQLREAESSHFSEIKILGEDCNNESVQEIGRDEFPINNLAGSDNITIEQEISKTTTNSLETIREDKIGAHLSTKLIEFINAQVSASLAKRLALKFDETVTFRQKIGFSVKAGSSVVYTVIWRHSVRNGTVKVKVDKAEYVWEYRANFGLLFEITSRGAEPAPVS